MNTGNPYASILISAYNHGAYLGHAIESVLNQTGFDRPFEIIVVDDGSTDETSKQIGPYRGRITYLRLEHRGQAAAFNRGIECARGEIICFLDADDDWRPDKLKYVARAFEHPDADAVFHYLNYINERREIIGTHPNAKNESEVCRDEYTFENYAKGRLTFFPPSSGISIRAGCLKKIGPVPEDYHICADGYLQLAAPFYARSFVLIRQYLGNLQIHRGNHWTGRAVTADAVKRQIQIQQFLLRDLERINQNAGRDISGLRRHLESVLTERGILLHNLEGRKWQAFLSALGFERYPKPDGRLYQWFKKACLFFSILIPYGWYEALRRTYQNSFLFRLFHHA